MAMLLRLFFLIYHPQSWCSSWIVWLLLLGLGPKVQGSLIQIKSGIVAKTQVLPFILMWVVCLGCDSVDCRGL